MSRRWARCRPMSSRAPPSMSAQMIAMIERLIATGHAYAAEGHVLFDVPSMPDYGQLSGRSHRRDDRRRAGRGRALQARSRRFRAVEAVAATIAGLGQPVGPRPAGLAYRMLGDERGASRRDLRHPWRRHRPHLPAPRERDRPERLGPSRQAVRALLDAQRLRCRSTARRCRSRSAISAPSAMCWRKCRARSARYAMLMTHYRQPLDWTEERLAEAKHALDRFYLALRRVTRRSPRRRRIARRACSRRWRTISTRRWRSPRCTIS